MNKGKLVLSPISSPKEGIQVVWKNKIFTLQLNFDKLGNNRVVSKYGRIFMAPKDLSELKQIMIEYEKGEYIGGRHNETTTSTIHLPLHPSDWQWALAHVGEEVEFNEEKVCEQCLDDPSAHDCKCNWSNYKLISMAKLVLPSKEIVYSEEELLKLTNSLDNNSVFTKQWLIGKIKDLPKLIKKS